MAAAAAVPAAAPPPADHPRSTLESFTIEGKLGAGAFAVVFKAVRHADGRTYALKELDLRGLSSTQQEDAIRETSVLASLDCPHIIKFHDSFLRKGKLYICMEYAPGGTLYDYIKAQPGPLPEAQTWRLLAQMLVGLNHMHARKVLHRDFKTLNVFLDAGLNVRLGDLGVAKVLSGDSAFAHTFIGTPYYLSPEVCEDQPYNEKSDVWALGVVLYECCTQRHPFDAQHQGGLILKILRGRYPPLTGYSRELTEVVKACLTLDASKRPDTNALLAMRCVRERAASEGVELPPEPPGRGFLAAASPSRRGIAAGRSFTSMRVRQQSAAADGEGSEQQQQPAQAVTVLTPAVVLLQPPDLPQAAAAAGSRGLAPRAPSRRALLSPREEARPQAGALPAGALVVGSAVRPLGGSPSQRRLTADDAAAAAVAGGAAAPALLEQLHLQGLRLDAASGKSSPLPPGDDAVAVDEAQQQQSERLQGLMQAVRKQIIQQVGPLAFDGLRQLLSAAAQAGNDAALEAVELVTAASRVVPPAQAAAVLPLLLKLAYLEAQLEGCVAAAAAAAES